MMRQEYKKKGRNFIMKRVISILAFLCFLFSSEVIINAYPTSSTISVPNVQQEYTNWCWAASSVSSLRYLGTTVSQSAFVTYVKGSATNVTGSCSDVRNGLSHYGASSTYKNGKLSFSDIRYQIYTNRKPAIAGLSGAAIGHMVVIRGYNQDTTGNYVIYMDPASGSSKTKLYSSFSTNWVETVYYIH